MGDRAEPYASDSRAIPGTNPPMCELCSAHKHYLCRGFRCPCPDPTCQERRAETDVSRSGATVVGPAHCERHKAHVVGCLDCAYAVAEADDLDLDEFLDVTEHIGWERPDGW